jgi:outer membrane protein TolC
MRNKPDTRPRASRLIAAVLAVALSAAGRAAAASEPGTNAPPAALASLRVLTLQAAGQIALSGNPSLRAAEARVRRAEAAVAQSRASNWPRVDVGAGVSRVEPADNALPSELDINSPDDFYTASATATWLLFDGMTRRFTKAAAAYGLEETVAARADTKRLLLSAVGTALFGAQLARENIAIARADEAFNLRLLKEARARREAGSGALSEELNFEVRANAARTEVIRAELSYRIALLGLAELMGIPGASFPEHLEPAPLAGEQPGEMHSPDVPALVAYAGEHRPDAIRARHAVRRARAGVGIARGAFYPALTLSAALEAERPGDPDFEAEDFGSVAALGLSLNILDGGLSRAQWREAVAERTEAERVLDGVMLAIASEVRRRAARVESARKQLVLQRKNTELVQRTRDLVEKEYTAGQGSLVRLNEAQRDLTAARSRLALALVSLRQAWHELATATGQVLEDVAE